MKLNLDHVLQNILTDAPIPWEEGEPCTLRRVLWEAVALPVDDANPVKMVARFDLITKLKKETGGCVDLKVEDIATLKDLVAKRWPQPIIGGAALLALDPPAGEGAAPKPTAGKGR